MTTGQQKSLTGITGIAGLAIGLIGLTGWLAFAFGGAS